MIRNTGAAALFLWLVASGAYAQTGVVSGATVTATGSTTARTLADRAADVVNVKDYGALCDGTTLDNTGFTAAAAAAVSLVRALYVPGGTCVLTNWAAPATPLLIQGDGQGVTILKRQASAASGLLLTGTSCNGLQLRDLTLDGNKANQTVTGYSAVFTGCYNLRIDRVEAKNSKGNGGAFVFISSTDLANSTRTELSNLSIHDNEGGGVLFQTGASNWTVRNSVIRNNTRTGISAINFVFPPVDDSFTNFAITGNDVSYNGTGISLTSFISGGTALAPVYGTSATVNNGKIVANTVNHNTGYGIASQGKQLIVADNIASFNGGTGTTYAGILASCSQCDVHDNMVQGNEYYGIDAGGATYTKVHNNVVIDNFNATADSGTGINCGACQHVDIAANFVSGNGTAAAGSQIRVSLYDSGGNAGTGFATPAEYVTIRGNHVISTATTQIGVWVLQDPQYMIIEDNWSEGAGDYQGFVLETTIAQVHRNRQDTWFVNRAVAPSNSFYVYPDAVEEITINSAPASTITALWPAFYAAYINGVYSTRLSAAGTGYTNSVTAVFSGGGCSVQPTATVNTDNAGHLVGVVMTSKGSGCSSAPAVAFVDASGSGAVATAHISSGQAVNGRELKILWATGLTVTNNTSNLRLLGNVDFTTIEQTMSTFNGWLNHWYEHSRSP